MNSECKAYWEQQLRAAFDGSGDWFTSHLLRLIVKADASNRERIRKGFPEAVEAFEAWHNGELNI